MHNEGNYKQGEKTAFRMGENNSKQRNWQRINLKNIKHVSFMCDKGLLQHIFYLQTPEV